MCLNIYEDIHGNAAYTTESTYNFNIHQETGSIKRILEWNTKQPSEKTYFYDDDANS